MQGALSVYSANELFMDFKVLAAVLTRGDSLWKLPAAIFVSILLQKGELFTLQSP